MSLVIPVGYGLAAFHLTGPVGTQPYVTTMGVDLSAAGGDFVAAADAAFLAYSANLLARTSNQLVLDHVTLSVGQDGPGGSVDSTETPAPGTSSGVFPPTALSLIARKVTNSLGRPGRGRMFLPGVVTESEVEQDGTISTASRNAINPVLQQFLEDLRDGVAGAPALIPLPPVLLHSGARPPDPVVQLTASETVGWIRGRIR